MTSQAKKAEKVDMIPARVTWNHVDRLDDLNGSLRELAELAAGDNELAVPALLNLLATQYEELRVTFVRSVGPEGPAKGGVA